MRTDGQQKQKQKLVSNGYYVIIDPRLSRGEDRNANEHRPSQNWWEVFLEDKADVVDTRRAKHDITAAKDQQNDAHMEPYVRVPSTTSLKHDRFVHAPIGSKEVTELAGITPILGLRLKLSGYGSAYSLLGQFMMLDRRSISFQDWLRDMCRANIKQTNDCYRCLNDWYINNVAR